MVNATVFPPPLVCLAAYNGSRASYQGVSAGHSDWIPPLVTRHNTGTAQLRADLCELSSRQFLVALATEKLAVLDGVPLVFVLSVQFGAFQGGEPLTAGLTFPHAGVP